MAATIDRPRLIVNADDLGLAEGVNRGILEAHRAGAVTSASMIVNLPAFDHAVRLAREAPALGVGLHLNLVLGRPLSRAPSLTDSRTGEFRPLGALARRALAGRVDPGDVRRECAAQIDRLARAGLAITHLDSHRHVHALPGVWLGVSLAADAARLRRIRAPLEPISLNITDLRAVAKKLALAASWRTATLGRPARRASRFVGVSLQGGRQFAVRLAHLLRHLPAGDTELMVHPGYDDAELARLDGYRAEREIELAALASAGVRDALRRVELTHFGRLGNAA